MDTVSDPVGFFCLFQHYIAHRYLPCAYVCQCLHACCTVYVVMLPTAARSFIHSECPSRCKVRSSMSGFGDAGLGTTLLAMDLVGV